MIKYLQRHHPPLVIMLLCFYAETEGCGTFSKGSSLAVGITLTRKKDKDSKSLMLQLVF